MSFGPLVRSSSAAPDPVPRADYEKLFYRSLSQTVSRETQTEPEGMSLEHSFIFSSIYLSSTSIRFILETRSSSHSSGNCGTPNELKW